MTEHSHTGPAISQKLAPSIDLFDRPAQTETTEISAKDRRPPRGLVSANRSSSGSNRDGATVRKRWAQQHPARGKVKASGGHRRRTSRTASLSERSALELIAAAQEAVDIGLPLNLFLTINLEQGQIGDCVRGIGQLLTYLREWVRKRGLKTACIWCQEWGPIVGQHVHILLHLPPSLGNAFMKRHRGWLAKCGAVSSSGLMSSRAVGKSREAALGDEQTRRDYRENLAKAVHYMIKEVVGPARERLQIREPARGGAVLNKRSGTSQNLGRLARTRRGRDYAPATPWDLAKCDIAGSANSAQEHGRGAGFDAGGGISGKGLRFRAAQSARSFSGSATMPNDG